MQTTMLSCSLCFVTAVMLSPRATAQQAPTILQVDYANAVVYVNDVNDQSKLASSAGPLVPTLPKGFYSTTAIFDLTAVNGTPVKGVVVYTQNMLNLRPNPGPGQAISDVTRTCPISWYFEFLQPDGTQIGSLFAIGFGGGAPMSGSPVQALAGNNTIVGGTGAYLGARGTVQQMSGNNTVRSSSQSEDPSMRRINGGGAGRYIFQIIPMYRPEVSTTTEGPAILHSGDFSLVTSAKPAKAGEILTLFATGLGPTRPGVDPGQPFPASGYELVNSPVDVLVNGTAVQALYAGGYPGAIDGYQVNFRLPDNTAPGVAVIALRVAWIGGAEVKIRIQ